VGDGETDLEGPCLADRCSVLQRFEDGQVTDPRGEPVRDRVENGSAFQRRRQPPSAVGVRGPGRRDRAVGVLEAALGDAGNQFLGGRAADLEPLVGIGPVPVDEHRESADSLHIGPFRVCPRR
jgi:hypothetical protein